MSKTIDASKIFRHTSALGTDNCKQPYEEVMSLYQKYKTIATPTVLQIPFFYAYRINQSGQQYQYVQYKVNHDRTIISLIQAIDENNISITAMFTGTLIELIHFVQTNQYVKPTGLALVHDFVKRSHWCAQYMATAMDTAMKALTAPEKSDVERFVETYYEVTGDVTDTASRSDFWIQFQHLHPNTFTRNSFYQMVASRYGLKVNNNNKYTGVRVKGAIKRKIEETEAPKPKRSKVEEAPVFSSAHNRPTAFYSLAPVQSRLAFNTQ